MKKVAAKVPPMSPFDNLAQVAVSAQSIVNTVEAILRLGSAKLGLSDWVLLQLLAEQPKQQQLGQLALRTGVTRQRIQKQVDELAQARYVTVEVNPTDKRLRTVSLTRAGAELLGAMSGTWSKTLSQTNLVARAKNLDITRHRLGNVAKMLTRVVRSQIKAAREGRERA